MLVLFQILVALSLWLRATQPLWHSYCKFYWDRYLFGEKDFVQNKQIFLNASSSIRPERFPHVPSLLPVSTFGNEGGHSRKERTGKQAKVPSVKWQLVLWGSITSDFVSLIFHYQILKRCSLFYSQARENYGFSVYSKKSTTSGLKPCCPAEKKHWEGEERWMELLDLKFSAEKIVFSFFKESSHFYLCSDRRSLQVWQTQST